MPANVPGAIQAQSWTGGQLRRVDRADSPPVLSSNDFLAGGYSVADMCCYPYILLADEGGVDIVEFPNVERWCRAIEGQKGYITIED